MSPLRGQHLVNTLNLVRVTPYLEWGLTHSKWGIPALSLVVFAGGWPGDAAKAHLFMLI